VLVAIAMIEFEHVDAITAMETIRKQQQLAFNAKQVNFLLDYMPRRRQPKRLLPQCTIM